MKLTIEDRNSNVEDIGDMSMLLQYIADQITEGYTSGMSGHMVWDLEE